MHSIPFITIGYSIHPMFQIIKNIRTMNNVIFWGIAPSSPYVNRRFGGIYRLNLHGRKLPEQETGVHQVTRQNMFFLIF
jgi:hypothetical protein